MASISAWGSPARRCQPWPIILPFFTSTAPTMGLGEVAPQPRRARSRACRRNCVSLSIWEGSQAHDRNRLAGLCTPFLPTLGLQLLLKQGRCELFRIKRLQIVGLLADSDQLNWQSELPLDGHDHPTLAGAVEFGNDEAGEPHGFVEFPRLV